MGSVTFTVQGKAVPKQAFRVSRKHHFQAPRIVAWQQEVGWAAKDAYKGEPLTCDVRLTLVFHLASARRADADNLAKAVLDGMRGILYVDDAQVMELHIFKMLRCKTACVEITAQWEPEKQPALLQAGASPPHPRLASRKGQKAAQ